MTELREVERRQGIRAAADLAQLVRETVAAGATREVLHLRIGALGPAFSRPHHHRLLRDALEPLISAGRTRVFDLPNGDVVAVAPPPALGLEAARRALVRSLDSAAGDILLALRLPEEAAQLLAATSDSLGLEPPPQPAEDSARGLPFTTAALMEAEQAIAQADLGPFTLSQAVCALDPEDATARVLWEDQRIAWAALAAFLLPGVDLAAAPALASRLARTAEQRLLAELVRSQALRRWRPVGVALAPATVLSPAFGRFEAALPAGRREQVTIAFRPADLLAAPAAFRAALDAVRARGFRCALEVPSAALLATLPIAPLGLDAVLLAWSPGLPAAPAGALQALLGGQEGVARVVLTGVDRPAGIAWGWEAGLRLFQGPLVERRRTAG
jgi:hypothetical protein